MRVEILSDRFNEGQRAIIDKRNKGGERLKLSVCQSVIEAGEARFVLVAPGTHCTIVSRIMGSYAIVQLDIGKLRCEIDINKLTLV